MNPRFDRFAVLLTFLAFTLLIASPALAGLTDAPGDRTGSGGLNLVGFAVKYNFTGVTNEPAAGEATVIHCTNVGSAPEVVAVQMFSYDGDNVWEGQTTIGVGVTITFSSQPTTIYFDDVNLAADSIFQGSGRVLAGSNKAKILCTGQVLDPVAATPAYMADLPLFPVGKPAKPTIRR